MLFNRMTYIGIDPTAELRPITYASLDGEMKLLALGQGSLDDVAAYCAGQQQALVAVCAPRRPNQGVMRQEGRRQQLSPQPTPGRWMNFRLAEFLIRQHNLHIPRTPGEGEEFPSWMTTGFHLFQRLDGLGYQTFPQDDSQRLSLEVYPHACFTALLGLIPFHKSTLEGRLQRQLVLYEAGLRVPDPMRFFEEITRHRLMKGILPVDELYTTTELDALAGAYTAWLAGNHIERVLRLGDREEGEIVVPVQELQARYR